jgi:DNA polymerase II small subunit
MENIIKKKELVKLFIKNNILISPDLLDSLNEEASTEKILEQVKTKISSEEFLILNKDLNNFLITKDKIEVNFKELDKTKASAEKNNDERAYKGFLGYINTEDHRLKKSETIEDDTKVNVLFSYKEESKKREIQDFVKYFKHRYHAIETILRNRTELQNITSISRILAKKDKENIALIGMVIDKQITKNNNINLTVEDPTGQIRVLINKNNQENYEMAKETVLDEVIGIVGVNGDKIIFASNILLPEIPLHKELKKAQDEAYAIFLSDLHVGSIKFLPNEFNKFLKWINQETGNDKQKEIANKVKYLFIMGDLVDGVGVYPDQEKELVITDIYKQYEECARLLAQIPQNIKVIICPGNHDAMRISEPQPPIYKDFANPIWQLKNVTLVSNPALINIHSSDKFPGFDVLMYHGYSFIYYADKVESIRAEGGIDRSDLIMKFLLKRRHLAPTHSSTLYVPDANSDPLVISKVPDFFVTGHIHKAMAANYRNITTICGSCWQEKTSFEEKLGLHPEPTRVPIINLQTREIKILRFDK